MTQEHEGEYICKYCALEKPLWDNNHCFRPNPPIKPSPQEHEHATTCYCPKCGVGIAMEWHGESEITSVTCSCGRKLQSPQESGWEKRLYKILRERRPVSRGGCDEFEPEVCPACTRYFKKLKSFLSQKIAEAVEENSKKWIETVDASKERGKQFVNKLTPLKKPKHP